MQNTNEIIKKFYNFLKKYDVHVTGGGAAIANGYEDVKVLCGEDENYIFFYLTDITETKSFSLNNFKRDLEKFIEANIVSPNLRINRTFEDSCIINLEDGKTIVIYENFGKTINDGCEVYDTDLYCFETKKIIANKIDVDLNNDFNSNLSFGEFLNAHGITEESVIKNLESGKRAVIINDSCNTTEDIFNEKIDGILNTRGWYHNPNGYEDFFGDQRANKLKELFSELSKNNVFVYGANSLVKFDNLHPDLAKKMKKYMQNICHFNTFGGNKKVITNIINNLSYSDHSGNSKCFVHSINKISASFFDNELEFQVGCYIPFYKDKDFSFYDFYVYDKNMEINDVIKKCFPKSKTRISKLFSDFNITKEVIENNVKNDTIIEIFPNLNIKQYLAKKRLGKIIESDLDKKHPDKKAVLCKDGWAIKPKYLEANTKNIKEDSSIKVDEEKDNSFIDTIKNDMISSAYKVAAKNINDTFVALISSKLEKENVSAFLNSEFGKGFMSMIIGYSMSYFPTISNNNKASKLADEFRINGMEFVGNQMFEICFDKFLPLVNKTIENLPKEESIKTRVLDEEFSELDYEEEQLSTMRK